MVRRWLPAPVPKCSVMHVAMSRILRWDWLTIELTVSEFESPSEITTGALDLRDDIQRDDAGRGESEAALGERALDGGANAMPPSRCSSVPDRTHCK
jgi:hypothetical protein